MRSKLMFGAKDIIEKLELQPHPEGGYFKEIYRCSDSITASALSDRYKGQRSCSTSIFYLLTPDTFSTMHKVASDELFHFYLGDTVEQLRIYPDGKSEIVLLGQNILAGELIQSVVPHGVWQGARLVDGGEWALLGATVSPGFDFADYIEGTKAELIPAYPDQKDLLLQLTRR